MGGTGTTGATGVTGLVGVVFSPSGTIDVAQLQVRVFGGNIQVFDGTGWIDMGAADVYIAAITSPLAASTVQHSYTPL